MSIRQRLFDGLADSPVYRETTDAEIESIITPESKGDNSADSGFGTGTPLSCVAVSHRDLKPRTIDVRRSLFSGKRPADDDLAEDSPCTKKLRELEQDEPTVSTQNVMNAVEQLETRDLIADGSREYTLPRIPGKHSDLASITPGTMADIVAGKYSDKFGKITIVDCRYPYEFEGGHIRGAINMYTKDEVHSLLKTTVTSKKPDILIFHCEFSSERGPKMYRFLRSQDREMNKDSYPQLKFPEVYLLDGGYKAFFIAHKELCDPINYKPMLHEDHAADLRHFRVKSKSWTAGGANRSDRRQRGRLNRHLSF